MAQTRNGSTTVTKLIEHLCRLITKYGSALNKVIDTAVIEGVITSAQGETAKAFLNSAAGACTIWKLITGY